MEFSQFPRYERIVILCPEVVTGGPEALHQLADAINRQGGHAVMAYFGKDDKSLVFAGDRLLCTFLPREAFQAQYKRYSPLTESEILLSQSTLLVFPEVYWLQAAQYRATPRAIWWLSVDNAQQKYPILSYPSVARELFADDTLVHFCQSRYAMSHLEQQGARQIVPLFDYVERSYRLLPAAAAAKATADEGRTVALFPRKGASLAQQFVDGAPELSYTLIGSMTRQQVGDALAASSVYLDFGHQPGKDRVPREAALAGNVVFLHEQGAAAHFGDYPLDKDYLFTLADVHSGSLKARVLQVLDRYSVHLERQAPLRQRIVLEKQEFDFQVASAFFTPG